VFYCNAECRYAECRGAKMAALILDLKQLILKQKRFSQNKHSAVLMKLSKNNG